MKLLASTAPFRSHRRHGHPRSVVEHVAQAFWRYLPAFYLAIIAVLSVAIEFGLPK